MNCSLLQQYPVLIRLQNSKIKRIREYRFEFDLRSYINGYHWLICQGDSLHIKTQRQRECESEIGRAGERGEGFIVFGLFRYLLHFLDVAEVKGL